MVRNYAQKEISHLLYRDDVKLYSSNDIGLKRLIRTVEQFSRDIRMEFGTEKCSLNAFRNGKWHKVYDFQLYRRSKNVIPAMGLNE